MLAEGDAGAAQRLRRRGLADVRRVLLRHGGCRARILPLVRCPSGKSSEPDRTDGHSRPTVARRASPRRRAAPGRRRHRSAAAPLRECRRAAPRSPAPGRPRRERAALAELEAGRKPPSLPRAATARRLRRAPPAGRRPGPAPVASPRTARSGFGWGLRALARMASAPADAARRGGRRSASGEPPPPDRERAEASSCPAATFAVQLASRAARKKARASLRIVAGAPGGRRGERRRRDRAEWPFACAPSSARACSDSAAGRSPSSTRFTR